MGIFDAVKNRFGRGNQDDYYEDDQYYDDEYHEDDYRDDEYQEGDYEEDEYDSYAEDDSYASSSQPLSLTGTRASSAFDGYTPLVSMSDVRSQELPAYTERTSASSARARGANTEIKTSLPYISDSSQESVSANTGALAASRESFDHVYTTKDTSDPLLRRHSLSNTGDFAATSPAYYASRSGVGHVRPQGQPRRTHKFREAIVIRPENYAEAEQVAINLRRGNAVVLVLTQTRPELAKRILDFSFGAAAALEGQVESIGERIYALTTEHGLTENEIELLQARGIL